MMIDKAQDCVYRGSRGWTWTFNFPFSPTSILEPLHALFPSIVTASTRQLLTMAAQSRGRGSKPTFQGFTLSTEPTSPEDEGTPTNTGPTHESQDEEDHMQDVEDAILEAQYSRDASVEDTLEEDLLSSGSSQSASDDDEDNNGESGQYLHHSNSSFLMANAFAPPFYNRPPTPLPPSPSLTSLLRPPFSAAPSRPTTPDSSENDTQNDTEAAVAKSARLATTVPRASPKVPTYEYYGFVLYITSTLGFCICFQFITENAC